eukprot:PLAT3859.2.p1 GENE.PLAT3859.2~~PLAT3859.2.p1  ORF type:complete len:527 (+),score=238.25 PLAT3859.2:78-1583(+)
MKAMLNQKSLVGVTLPSAVSDGGSSKTKKRSETEDEADDDASSAKRKSLLHVWTPGMYSYERGIAFHLRRLMRGEDVRRMPEGAEETLVQQVESRLGLKFSAEQRGAVSRALDSRVAVITGGPGTGKTTITRAIVTAMASQGAVVRLAAPTGRAALRLSHATGAEAATIHRLLDVQPGTRRFVHDDSNPLDLDVLVVDEASMVDIPLMAALLRAMPAHARLLLIGDVDQLPSVGPGSVLADLIRSHRVPVTRLRQLWRTGKQSGIAVGAHAINSGSMPELAALGESELAFQEESTVEGVAEYIRSFVEHVAAQPQLDVLSRVQVLTPMRRTAIGSMELNRVLQQTLNADGMAGAGLRASGGDGSFFIGDKVMQTRNNYTQHVFNGDLGRIVHIGSDELRVQFDHGVAVTYATGELSNLQLAYASTVHKFQGCEADCIVLPMHTAHYPMLTRNLLYTAVTRARKLVLLVGSKRAIYLAIAANQVQHRHSGLRHFLQATAEEY